MGKLKFSDHFWDDDFNGTIGYDTIINHMKDGKKLCDSYIDFLTKRAKLEEDYGRNLIKLASQNETVQVMGTMQASWMRLKKESEGVGTCHLELSKKLSDLAAELQTFREKQKNERNKLNEKMTKLQKDKRTAYDQAMKHKKTYEQKCRENDACMKEYENKSVYTPKEEDRLKRNLGKAKTNVENADSLYQSSIKQLDDLRKHWILEMTDDCEIFETMESDRIKFLRNQIWVYTNLGSLQAVGVDERYENVRLVLEHCDDVKDIQLFIQTNGTGTTKPAPLNYENHYHPAQGMISSNPPSRHGSQQDYAQVSEYQMPVSNKPLALSSAGGPPKHRQISAYQMPPSSKPYAVNTPKLRLAEFDYHKQGPKELELKTGDVIEVMRLEDTDWGIGKVNGRLGAFPLSFTTELPN